uniref:Uncharacterized protein n=1 Tax=Anopheles culicifacies TaxID=139723 RepID=A0A182MUH3_9DIPT
MTTPLCRSVEDGARLEPEDIGSDRPVDCHVSFGRHFTIVSTSTCANGGQWGSTLAGRKTGFPPALKVRVCNILFTHPIEVQLQFGSLKMRTLYTIYFLLAASFFAGIVIAGVLQISKDQLERSQVSEVAVRSKRQLLPILGGYKSFPNFGFNPQPNAFSGSAASASAIANAQGFDGDYGGLNGISGSNAASNALSQNIGGFGFSGANANANAFNQQYGPDGFGSSAANAQAQSFQSDGPFGSFGASAANAASQGFSAGPGGLTGSAGFSGSQTYNLPGRRKISLAYSNGFSLANGQPSATNGFSISQS